MNYSAIVLCAGKGSRSGLSYNKMLYRFNDKTVYEMTMTVFLQDQRCKQIVVVTKEDEINEIKELVNDERIVYVFGGKFEWIESELKELASAESDMPAVGAVAYPRVTKGAAEALLARMYLNAEVYTGTARWEDARSAAEAVIGMGYSLCSKYEDLFLQDNGENPETQKES